MGFNSGFKGLIFFYKVRYLEEEAIYCPVRSDRSMTQCCIQNSSYIIYNCFYFVLSVVKVVINVEKNYE